MKLKSKQKQGNTKDCEINKTEKTDSQRKIVKPNDCSLKNDQIYYSTAD